MSRKKKSRKPGTGSIGFLKDENKKIAPPSNKKPNKKTGKQPGNRQQEGKVEHKNTQGSLANKDPRIGSKKPIVLTTAVAKSAAQPATKAKKVKQTPIAAIRAVESGEALDQELTLIENDEHLQSILAKQEDELALTEQEVDYFNEKMQRHQQIRELLGLEDEDEDEDYQQNLHKTPLSEDALWDKFDNSDLTDFE